VLAALAVESMGMAAETLQGKNILAESIFDKKKRDAPRIDSRKGGSGGRQTVGLNDQEGRSE